MYRSEWDFEQHARYTEREALAAAERARLLAVARCAPARRRDSIVGVWLRSVGSRLERWVSGAAPTARKVPAHCRERVV